MKKIRKLLGFVLTFILVFAAGITTAHAGTTGTDITIHKIKMDSFEGYTPKNNINASKIDNIQTWFEHNAVELAGVKFNYYRVDQSEYAQTPDKDLALISEATLKGTAGVVAKGSFITTSTGFTINDLADGRYIFYEDDKNGMVTDSMIVPFVLNLPAAKTDLSGNVVYKTDGTIEYLTSMDIYPKNVIEEPVAKKSIRVLGEDEDSAKVGDTVHYILTTSIPVSIAHYIKFEFVDTLAGTLDYAGNLTVTLNGTALVPADYTATEPAITGGGMLTVSFTQAGLDKMAAHGGTDAEAAKLQVAYDAKINETAKTVYTTLNDDDEIINNFKIKYQNSYNQDGTAADKETTSNDVYAYVGGKTFIKTNDYPIDDETYLLKLQGATFGLYYDNGSDPLTPVTWTDELIQLNDAGIGGLNAAKFGGTVAAGQPIVLKSGADGTFEIKGLQAATTDFNGNYKLDETAAPTDYVQLSVPINFKVTKDGYAPEAPQQIKNAKRPHIPQTGGIGTIIFLAAGLVLMGAAIVALKRKEQPEK